MNLFQIFDTDTNKQAKGVPVTYPANDDKSVPTFYIAHASRENEEWAKAYERHTRPLQQQIRLKTMKSQQWLDVSVKVFLDAILKGWENIQDENGKPIEYSKENAKALMERLPALYADLEERSTQFDLFRKNEIEQAAGN